MTLGKMASAVCILFLLAAVLPGQTVSSSIVGTVLDPASASVAGARVTLTDTGTGNARTGVSDVSGIFRFLEIPPGTYTLNIQSSGFKSFTESNIVVEASQTRAATCSGISRWCPA
jgi:hypothetical protein